MYMPVLLHVIVTFQSGWMHGSFFSFCLACSNCLWLNVFIQYLHLSLLDDNAEYKQEAGFSHCCMNEKDMSCQLSCILFSVLSWDHQLMQLLDWPLSLLCFYWFQPDTETDRKKGPFQEEVKWSSSGWRVAFTTLLTRWKNVTIMEALAADSELIGWVPPGQSGARSPCSQTRANKRAEESAWTRGDVSLYQASL